MIDDKQLTAWLATIFVSLAVIFLVFPVPAFGGTGIGHLVGIIGSILMLMTLIYPYRKRILKKKGRKNPLNPHIYYGIVGPTLVVVHSGHKFASTIGVVVFLGMLLVVLSGIVGRFLFKKVNRSVREQKKEIDALHDLFRQRKTAISREDLERYLAGQVLYEKDEAETDAPEGEVVYRKCRELQEIAHAIAEGEQAVKTFATVKTAFTRWILVHIYLSVFLFAMLLVHILSTFYYGFRWL